MLFLYILATLCVLLWILLPLFKPREAHAGDPLMDERIQSVESVLKNLYQSGHKDISDEDFSHIERRLLLSLAKLFHQAGISPDQVAPAESKEKTQPKPIKEAAAAMPKAAAAATRYCGKCGHAVKSDFAFCPQCGCHLNAA